MEIRCRSRALQGFKVEGTRIAGTIVGPGKVRTVLGLLEGQVSHEYPPGTEVDVLVRPDDVIIDPAGPGVAEIEERVFRGANFLYTLSLPGGTRLLSLAPSHDHYAPGVRVSLRPAFTHLVLFPRGDVSTHADSDDN